MLARPQSGVVAVVDAEQAANAPNASVLEITIQCVAIDDHATPRRRGGRGRGRGRAPPRCAGHGSRTRTGDRPRRAWVARCAAGTSGNPTRHLPTLERIRWGRRALMVAQPPVRRVPPALSESLADRIQRPRRPGSTPRPSPTRQLQGDALAPPSSPSLLIRDRRASSASAASRTRRRDVRVCARCQHARTVRCRQRGVSARAAPGDGPRGGVTSPDDATQRSERWGDLPRRCDAAVREVGDLPRRHGERTVRAQGSPGRGDRKGWEDAAVRARTHAASS